MPLPEPYAHKCNTCSYEFLVWYNIERDDDGILISSPDNYKDVSCPECGSDSDKI